MTVLPAGTVGADVTTESIWVRPAGTAPEEPLWGHRNGIRIGVPHQHGPWGILRIFYPSITGSENTIMNFLAVEPIVDGKRCLSELEPSELDNRPGKRMWSADEPDFTPRDPLAPARGVVERHGTTETLSFYVMVEPFINKARVHLQLTFRSDRPDEVQVKSFASPGSASMSRCIITATMGNYARLRQLWLKDRCAVSRQVWPDYKDVHFTPHASFKLDQLWRNPAGDMLAAATPDEKEPWLGDAPGFWRYTGKLATQYWTVPSDQVTSSIVVKVNGRYTYWMSENPIPGGIAYENFELEMPFRDGEYYSFGVTTRTVEQLREGYSKRP
jgi:hypothetical protein